MTTKILAAVWCAVLLGAGVLFVSCSDTKNAAEEKIERPSPTGEYAGKKNPKAGDAEAIKKGKQTFIGSCASCHGESGKGDGAAGAALPLKPSNLTNPKLQDLVGDDYLFWRISEGGQMEPFKSQQSAMAPFKAALSEDQRWEVVAFIRSLKAK